MNTPVPNPARFDGHWYPRRRMAELLGIGAVHLDALVRQGRVPAGAIEHDQFGRRLYDAGAVLRWQQARTDRRRRP